MVQKHRLVHVIFHRKNSEKLGKLRRRKLRARDCNNAIGNFYDKNQTTNQALIRTLLIAVIIVKYIRVLTKPNLSIQNETYRNNKFYKEY